MLFNKSFAKSLFSRSRLSGRNSRRFQSGRTRAAGHSAQVEMLENRQLLAAAGYMTQVGNELRVYGTNATNDSVVVQQNGFFTQVTLSDSGGSESGNYLISSIRFYGYNGNDFFNNTTNVASFVYMYGGNDIAYGGNGNDYFSMSSGNDYVYGRNGNDRMFLGSGNDTGYGAGGNDQIIAGLGNDYAHGGSGNDSIWGESGNDSLIGSSGNDDLMGGSGHDFMNAGSGHDDAWGGSGNDTAFGGSGNDRLMGENGHDEMHGDSGNDSIWGGNHNDQLFAGSGQDDLMGGGGNDVLVSIDGDTNDDLWGESGFDSFWVDKTNFLFLTISDSIHDATGSENSTNVHKVGQFANGADKTLNGDSLLDPSDSSNQDNYSDNRLFASSGPDSADVDQNGLADCWLLAGLGAVADANPNAIRQTVAELGDGTYVVELGGTFYRVDGSLSETAGGNLRYAGLGRQDSIWVPIVEKAYAFYRTGAGTYASLAFGWSSTVFDAIGDSGAASQSFTSGSAALNHINSKLSLGHAVVVNINTPSAGCPCVGNHAYTAISVNYQQVNLGWGVILNIPVSVVLRNPWGVDGAGNDGNNDGLVTVTANQLVASMYGTNGIQSARVS